MRKQFTEVVEEEKQLALGLDALRDLPCVTLDGHRMPLWVNTGLLADVARAQQRGAEGVGLYRTEVPFMINQRFPSEKGTTGDLPRATRRVPSAAGDHAQPGHRR
jgi:phosphotransferase system enzyme I (PtsP)